MFVFLPGPYYSVNGCTNLKVKNLLESKKVRAFLSFIALEFFSWNYSISVQMQYSTSKEIDSSFISVHNAQ